MPNFTPNFTTAILSRLHLKNTFASKEYIWKLFRNFWRKRFCKLKSVFPGRYMDYMITPKKFCGFFKGFFNFNSLTCLLEWNAS